jgi:hypothetical protein
MDCPVWDDAIGIYRKSKEVSCGPGEQETWGWHDKSVDYVCRDYKGRVYAYLQRCSL